MINIQYGTDPEFAIWDDKNKEYVEAAHFIPGCKRQPFQLNDRIGVQPDGVAIEMTVPPANNKEEFLAYLTEGVDEFKKLLKMVGGPNLKLKAISSAEYNQITHPDCMTFGCDPSYNPYTGKVNQRPDASSVGNLRTFGFHIHFGISKNMTEDEVMAFMRYVHEYMYPKSREYDKDTKRDSIYGGPDYRVKYKNDLTIIEYRTLGGYMINHAELVIDWAIQLAEKYFNGIDIVSTEMELSGKVSR